MSSVVRDLICRSHLSKKKNGRATRKKTTRQPEKQSAGQPKQNDRSTRKKKRQGRAARKKTTGQPAGPLEKQSGKKKNVGTTGRASKKTTR